MNSQSRTAEQTKTQGPSTGGHHVTGGEPKGLPTIHQDLQHRIGNSALQRLLQAKLEVSRPDDPSEQEADRVADAALRMPEPTQCPAPPSGAQIKNHRANFEQEIERQPLEEEEILQAKPLAPGILQRRAPHDEEEMPLLAKAASKGDTLTRKVLPEEEEPIRRSAIPEEEEPIQRRLQYAAAGDHVSSDLEEAIHNLAGRGSPLAKPVRDFMEPRFGADFSTVRVHTDAHAHELARAVNAQAFTVGRDVVFCTGHYAAETERGKHLLAHELTHVLQERDSGTEFGLRCQVVQRQNTFPSSGPGVIDEAAQTPKPITRSEQAYHAYGLECVGASIMYMLQSYGLVPPDMTREQFEYAFTPLSPHGAPKVGYIKVGTPERVQADALPVDLFSVALQKMSRPPKNVRLAGELVTKTEATLRGANKDGFPTKYVVSKFPEILKAFFAQSEQPHYQFMKAHRPSDKALEPGDKDKWSATNDLDIDSIDDEYFQKGNTLLVELCLSYPATDAREHYCVVVAKAKHRLLDSAPNNPQPHFLYPADDPLYGTTLVMAPPITRRNILPSGVTVGDEEIGMLKYNGRSVFMVASGNEHVLRRKAG